MRTSLFLGAALACSILGAGPALSQQSPGAAPPPVLEIWRETVKPGRAAAHEAAEARWARATHDAGLPGYYLGMTDLSGPEAWFVGGYDNFASLEQDLTSYDVSTLLRRRLDSLTAHDGAQLDRTSALLARLLPAQSRWKQTLLPVMRYGYMNIIRVRPGHEAEFLKVMSDYVAAHEKVKSETSWALYEIVAGTDGPAFLLFSPMRSLAAFDQLFALQGPLGNALNDADATTRAWQASVRGEEGHLLRFRPMMSHMPETFTDVDPDFWRTH